MAYSKKMVSISYSQIAKKYMGGLAHMHTTLSNHPGHNESNLSIDRIVDTLKHEGLIGSSDSPLHYLMLNEHPSDPTKPKTLNRLSLRARKLLRQRQRPFVKNIPVLYGLEVSLLSDGGTDLTPRIADKCSLIIASRHGLPKDMVHDADAISELFLAACDNPSIDVIGHPARYSEGIVDIKWEAIFERAIATGTAIEINLNTYPSTNTSKSVANFWLNWLAEISKSGVDVFIGSDIHNKLQLDAFISQWKQLDERAGQEENHLVRFLYSLKSARISPKRIVNADYDNFLDWLNLDKSQRARLH